MHENKIEFKGPYERALKENDKFLRMVQFFQTESKKKRKLFELNFLQHIFLIGEEQSLNDSNIPFGTSKISRSYPMTSSNYSAYTLSNNNQENFKMGDTNQNLIEDIIVKEENFAKINSANSLKTFFSKSSLYLIILMLVCFVLAHSTKLAADLWLSYWFRDKYGISKAKYTYVYSILFISSLVIFFLAFMFYSFMSIKGKIIFLNCFL